MTRRSPPAPTLRATRRSPGTRAVEISSRTSQASGAPGPDPPGPRRAGFHSSLQRWPNIESETVREFEIDFGNKNFLSIAHKRTDLDAEDPTEFISLARGYKDVQGNRRYRSNVTIPYRSDLVSWLLIGLDLTRHDGRPEVPEDTEAFVVSHDTARVALRELDLLIDHTEDEEPDPLQSDIFDARDELDARLNPEADDEDERQQRLKEAGPA